MKQDHKAKFDELVSQINKSPLEFIYWITNNKNPEILYYTDLNKNSLLIHAIGSDSIKIHNALFIIIVDHPSLLFQENKENINALIWAAINGRKHIIEKLYELKFDVDHLNSQGDTALTYASCHGQVEIVKFLLSKNVNYNNQNSDGNTALIRASYNNHTNVVSELIGHKVDLNIKNKYGFTALTWAAKKNHVEIFRLLIDNDADYDIKNINERTPLMLSAEYGHIAILLKLIELHRASSSEMDFRDVNGTTALMWAAHNGHIQCVEALIKAGFNVNNIDMDGNTALILAIYRNHVEIVRMLINYRADVNSKTKHGYNIIFWAIEQEFNAIVLLLIKNGVSINTKNNSGKNILDLACNNIELTNLIHKYLVTADIPNNKLSKNFLKLRNRLLKTEVDKLVRRITELAEIDVSKEEFNGKIYDYIEENIMAEASNPKFKNKIDNSINELYEGIYSKKEISKLNDQKIGFINVLSNSLGRFFKIFSTITFGSFRNKIINEAAENIKIIVMVHVYKDITSSFVEAASLKGIDQAITQNIDEKKSKSFGISR